MAKLPMAPVKAKSLPMMKPVKGSTKPSLPGVPQVGMGVPSVGASPKVGAAPMFKKGGLVKKDKYENSKADKAADKKGGKAKFAKGGMTCK